jgi:Multicopper oxidase
LTRPARVDVDRDIVLMFAVPAGAASSQASVLVNGSPRPDVPLRSGERLRLRLINAITSRGLSLKFEGHAPWIVAIDGQPTEPFLAHEGRVGLGPGLPSKNMKSIKSLISKTVFRPSFWSRGQTDFSEIQKSPPRGVSQGN